MVLVLDEEADDAVVIDAVLAGADAVLHWGSHPAAVMAVLSEVSQGGSVLVPNQIRAVASVARAAASRPNVVLSRREAQILASIARGQAVKQTARDLGISPKTVENLQGRLFRKLGVRNRAQAVTRAHGMGLLAPSVPWGAPPLGSDVPFP
jgi:DNA-binding NarL/FixJ family response regulator